jgi:hypothetical protein
MQKGAMMVATIPGMNATKDLASLWKIELVFLNWCAPPAENPYWCAPLAKLLAEVTLN